MSHWQKIRDTAAQTRREICDENGLDFKKIYQAETLIEATVEHFELELSPESANSEHLRKCLAVLEDDIIFFNNELKNRFKQFCIAHEIAHHVLHHTSVHCSAEDIESFSTDEEIPSPIRDVVGYGANERREREANLFALEFLLPCEILLELFINENTRSGEISDLVGLPKMIVSQQLARAVLTPKIEKRTEIIGQNFDLDESQKAAAESEDCPLLITAGPGTGKTKTLIERILFLLEDGTAPNEILALTFSNKATEEMRERIGAARPLEAKQMEIMTFHSFGLDILRKFAPEAGLEKDSPLIEKLDAINFLEKNLKQLNLVHFQSLSEPTRRIPDILAAISRAKDELKSPADYKILAERMNSEANSEDERRDAEKCMEIARVYEIYQKHLEDEKILDFGDLIFRACRLLREREDIRGQIKGKYKAILVDEYQDINRASGKLLQAIADDGAGLWAVGDLRQSIYRWRGASPANLRMFSEDYPNASNSSLEKNYRSLGDITKTFSHFATQMQAAPEDVFCDWKTSRESVETSHIKFEIAGNERAEAENLTENILRYNADGTLFREQAVICRTHSQLKKIAETLTVKNIPILYLGDLFEREEIRDLLALLDLKTTLKGFSLVRAATFDEYKIPLVDVQKILAESGKDDADFQQVLADQRMDSFLSEGGKKGWQKLKNHLSKIENNTSAWNFLSEYIFEQSAFLQTFFENEDVQNQQKLLAVYQFLRFAKNAEKRFSGIKETQIHEFLNHVRRLARFGEDKPFAQVPNVAENMEAVRLLTVHAAKGLEFDVVYLPFLGKGHFPGRKQGAKYPTPKDLIEADADFHDEEEECLFFVGMSRAKDKLHLSRSTTYGGKNSQPSPFIEMLEKVLPEPIFIEAIETAEAEIVQNNDFYAHNFHASQIKRYEDCPRKYYYKDVLKLDENTDDAVYLKFHRTVYQTIGELQKMHNSRDLINEKIALERLSKNWDETDLSEHAYAEIYRNSAEEMLKNMCRRIAGIKGEILQDSLTLELANGVIFIQPDFMEVGETVVSIKRFRTKKAVILKDGKKEAVEDADVILQLAARNTFKNADVKLNKVYLPDDIEREIPLTKQVEKLRLTKFENIINNIKSGDFRAKPNSEKCPNCAYFFICPK
ncbi:MAG: UvrD-helicase domain-containing protein [Aridibacter sp.]